MVLKKLISFVLNLVVDTVEKILILYILMYKEKMIDGVCFCSSNIFMKQDEI